MFTGGASPTPTSPSSGEVGSVKLRKLVSGQTLMREGDPPGPIYVICAGRLRVYRRDLTAVNAVVDLATLGTGEVIGELGPILGKLRSATV
jgi:CRP-like cAMP-binding protein